MNTLEIELDVPKNVADICAKSIGIETGSENLRRSTVDMHRGRKGLSLVIKSKDLHAMRAALNTYLRWVIMCCGIMKSY